MKVFKSLSSVSRTEGPPVRLLLAVSGGADSVAMLTAVHELQKKLHCELSVITVNHRIRLEVESAGDAAFVQDYCLKLGVRCTAAVLPENAVFQAAAERKKGIEEAARFLRYREFEKAAAADGAEYILTAHNRNDYFETVLMRLFQGAEGAALAGIAEHRGCFVRPMLDLKRSEIEDYLKCRKRSWREDVTNFEHEYLRNKIRSLLIPALNRTFGSGWEAGLLQTVRKVKEEGCFIEALCKQRTENAYWSLQQDEKTGRIAVTDFNTFAGLEPVLKRLFLKEGFNVLGTEKRIPHTVFKTLAAVSKERPAVFSGGFCLKKEDGNLFLFKKEEKTADRSETFFSVWIEKEGTVCLPAGPFEVTKTEDGFFLRAQKDGLDELGPFYPPFCIRSRLPGDTVFIEGVGKKTLKKIINEWNPPYAKRNILPIIEEKGLICGIYGSVLGKKNWYAMPFRRKK